MKNISIDQCVNIVLVLISAYVFFFNTVLHTYTISQFNDPSSYDLYRASFVTRTKTKNFVKIPKRMSVGFAEMSVLVIANIVWVSF